MEGSKEFKNFKEFKEFIDIPGVRKGGCRCYL